MRHRAPSTVRLGPAAGLLLSQFAARILDQPGHDIGETRPLVANTDWLYGYDAHATPLVEPLTP
jgi:hypothetical protein